METVHGFKIINPLFAWTSEDCWNYIKENNLEICKDYNILEKTRTCLLCNWITSANNNDMVTKLKSYYPDTYNKYIDLAKYCYNNNVELQKIFSSYEEYFTLWLDKNKMLERLLAYYKKK